MATITLKLTQDKGSQTKICQWCIEKCCKKYIHSGSVEYDYLYNSAFYSKCPLCKKRVTYEEISRIKIYKSDLKYLKAKFLSERVRMIKK